MIETSPDDSHPSTGRSPLPVLSPAQQREAHYLYARALMEGVDEVRLYEVAGEVVAKELRIRDA